MVRPSTRELLYHGDERATLPAVLIRLSISISRPHILPLAKGEMEAALPPLAW